MRTKDRESWLREVVAVATRLFLEKGFDDTSMEEVAAALGVSKPTIYEDFGSKQVLLEAVVDDAIKGYDISWLEAAARDGVPFDAFVDRLADEVWSGPAGAANAPILQLLLREGPRSPALVATYMQRMREPGRGAIRDIISSAMARGECRRMDPIVVQHMLLAPAAYITLQRFLFGEKVMPPELAAAFLEASREALKDSLVVKAAVNPSRSASPRNG
ncbi:MAG: TetR/AcrR family transcriptional regulator [Micropepsaceae bacterium]